MTKLAPTLIKSNNGKPPTRPLWRGPQEDGVTFSLLSKFINCRHRFYLRVIHGVVEDEGFKHALEFGSMWHACEEAHCGKKPWLPLLSKYHNSLVNQYPGSERAIRKWFEICKLQFPLYIKHWEKHKDEKGRKPLLEEVAFKVPYTLPSGRSVTLRGKWDAVMLLSSPSRKEPELYRTWMENWPKAKFGIENQENKTKGEIDEIGILHTLGGNLQTMLYHVALREALEHGNLQFLSIGQAGPLIEAFTKGIPITGMLFNVIRRPLSDRYAIKQKKSETEKQFYVRLADVIEKDPKKYFMRWRTLFTPADVEEFKQHTFDPILEQLCDWWEWICQDPTDPWDHEAGLRQNYVSSPHWQAPWGVYDSLASGFRGDYFEFLTTGRQFGLRKIKTLYPELESK